MNRNLERRRDFVGSIIFIGFIVVLLVGGYFLTRYLTSDTQKKEIIRNENNKIKVDSKKEFVYYENETTISEDPDIVHKDIVINVKGASTINEILKNENNVIRSSVKKISENDVDKSKEILYKDNDIFFTKERNYSFYESSKYLSVVITDGEFNCYTGSTITGIKTYNFSLTNGKLLSNETMLGYNSLTIDDVKNKIATKLSADQTEFGEETIINVDETLNAINIDNASIYVNKTGKLVISIIVKTNEESYNDTVELN